MGLEVGFSKVSFEQAKELKELKYNFACNSMYYPDGQCAVGCTTRDHNKPYNGYDEGTISCPSLNRVIEWADEVHEIHCGVIPMIGTKDGKPNIYYHALFLTYHRDENEMNHVEMNVDSFDSRYEAGSFVVDYIIKTLKNGKNGE